MNTSIETRLRRAYVANGGTEEEFELRKAQLIDQYRDRVTIDAVLEEATRPLTLNDAIRHQLQDVPDDGVRRLFANQKGNPEAA